MPRPDEPGAHRRARGGFTATDASVITRGELYHRNDFRVKDEPDFFIPWVAADSRPGPGDPPDVVRPPKPRPRPR